MRIVVTGAAGSIRSDLVVALCAEVRIVQGKSETGATINGFRPDRRAVDGSFVKVECHPVPRRRSGGRFASAP